MLPLQAVQGARLCETILDTSSAAIMRTAAHDYLARREAKELARDAYSEDTAIRAVEETVSALVHEVEARAELEAVLKMQSASRGKRARELLRTCKTAAIKWQAIARGRHARAEAAEARVREVAFAVSAAAFDAFESMVERVLQQTAVQIAAEGLKERAAAVRFQSALRGLIARRRHKEAESAATLLQAAVRGSNARADFQVLIVTRAAIKLQQLFVEGLDRKSKYWVRPEQQRLHSRRRQSWRCRRGDECWQQNE